MGLLPDDFQPLKCPRCGNTAIKLIFEGLPIIYKNKCPNGICRKCKREVILELRGMLRRWENGSKTKESD